jgi:hypothetical protein
MTSNTSFTTATTALSAETRSGVAGRSRAAGVAAIAAGAVGLAGILTCNWEGGADSASYLRSLTAHPTQSMISMALLHYGYLLFVPVAFVLARLARHGAPKLAASGLILSILGSGLSGFLVTDAYDLSIAQHLPIQTAVRVSDGVSGWAMFGIALPTVFGSMLGLVMLLLAMWRAGWMPLAPALVMLLGWVVGFHAHDLVRASAAFGMVALAFVWTGVRILRGSDEEFQTGLPA